MEKLNLILLFAVICLLTPQFEAFAQCTNNNTLWPGADNLTPGCTEEVVNMEAGTYAVFNVIAGINYQFRTCGSGWDTQLTGFEGASSTVLFYNDDAGGSCSDCNSPVCGSGTNPSNLIWNATFTGQLRVVLDRFNCLSCDINNCSSWGTVPLRYKANNPVNFTISAGTLCPGDMLTLTATPDGGSFSGTGVTGTTFTAPNIAAGTTQTYTITYTLGGCSVTQSLTVSAPLPTANCKNFTVELGSNGMASIAAADVDNGSTSTCGTADFALSQNSFNCTNVGVVPVTLTVSDVYGSSTCTANVTVEDTVGPELVCRPQVVQLDATGQYTLTESDVLFSKSDICSSVTVTNINPNQLDCSSAGSTTVTVTADDSYGNSSTCVANIFVLLEPATLQCRSAFVTLDNNGEYTLTEADLLTINNSNCVSFSFQSANPAMVDCSHLDAAVSVNVSAGDGNDTETCTASIIVKDETPPMVQCNTKNIALPTSGIYALTEADVVSSMSDNCGDVHVKEISPLFLTCGILDIPTIINVTAEDGSGNSASCSAYITAVDTSAPDLVCGTKVVALDAAGEYTLTEADVLACSTDNCGTANFVSAVPALLDCANVGQTVDVLVTANDGNGNTNTCHASIEVLANEDNFECLTTIVDLDATGQYNLLESDVWSGTGGNCSTFEFESISPTMVDCSQVGQVVPVVVTISDGNTSAEACTANIIVRDELLPTLQCATTSIQLDASGEYTLAENDVLSTSSDNCGAVSVLNIQPAQINCAQLGNTVNVTVLAIDSKGRLNTCTASVMVEDNLPPVATCIDQTVVFNGQQEIALSLNQLFDTANSSDNCGSVDLISPIYDPLISCDEVGTTIPIGVTIADASGNTANCTATITVEGLPCGLTDNGGIGCDGTSTYDPQTGTFTIGAPDYSPEYPYTLDEASFVYFDLCGDGEITALVTGLQGTGFAGVMMRESNAPEAPKMSIGTNTINRVRKEVRIVSGYPAWPQAVLAYDQFWVRLTRTGISFRGYASTDGDFWYPYLFQNIQMDECILIGLYTYSEKPGSPVTATFEQVAITNGSVNFQQENPEKVAIGESLDPKPDIQVFPNPTHDVLYIDWSSFLGQPAEIQFFNSIGEVVRYEQFDDSLEVQQLDVSALVPGIYNLVIQLGAKRMAKRVVIARE